MSRVMCYRCFWPEPLCWCRSITPMATRTRLVLLMHPKEHKHEKAATGRLTHLCLANSRIIPGVGFDQNEEVQAIIRDPANFPVLLYPGREAVNLTPTSAPSIESPLAPFRAALGTRTLTVFLLDATWALGRKMLRLCPTLQALPRVMFTPSAPSRYIIKQQPHPSCLSTLEATHELLLALQAAGLDDYPLPDQLLSLFQRMQDYQLRCACDPALAGYRRGRYKPPSERVLPRGRSGARRRNVFQMPAS
jgi:DTW domain-containing protein YfiP